MADQEKIEELMAGYALGILDEDDKTAAEQLLATDPAARKALAEFESITGGLAMSIEPQDLPAGHLERFRQKAGVTITTSPSAAPAPIDLAARRAQKATRRLPAALGWAAAIVLFVTSGLFGGLWYNSNQQLNQAQSANTNLMAVLSSPTLRVSDLKPSAGSNINGNIRMYGDPTTNKALLVAQNLPVLSSDKEYEVWLISGDRPDKAGLLGSGPGNSSNLYDLSASAPLSQYQVVAITVEKRGGVDKPSQSPILVGTIPA